MGLPWIKLDKEFPTHRKSIILAAHLGDERAWTYAVELWLWVARHAPDGDLRQMPDTAIARAAGWKNDAATFVDALRRAGFLSDDNFVTGWVEYNAAHFRKQAADKARNERRALPARQPTRPEKNEFTSDSLVTHSRVIFDSSVSHQQTVSVETRDRDRDRELREEINTNTKNLPLFENPKSVTLGEGEPDLPKARKGRPRKNDPDRAVEQADGEAWIAKAREVIGLTPEESPWDKSTWFVYRRVRRQYGAQTLLRSLEALISDPWASKQGLRTLLSGSVIQKGLAKWRREAGALHVERAAHEEPGLYIGGRKIDLQIAEESSEVVDF